MFTQTYVIIWHHRAPKTPQIMAYWCHIKQKLSARLQCSMCIRIGDTIVLHYGCLHGYGIIGLGQQYLNQITWHHPQLKGDLVIIHKINKTLGKHCNTIFQSILTTFSSHDLTKKCKKPGHQAIRLQNQIDLICGLKISWKSLYSLVYNSAHTVMKFCVMWDGLSLLHVT